MVSASSGDSQWAEITCSRGSEGALFPPHLQHPWAQVPGQWQPPPPQPPPRSHVGEVGQLLEGQVVDVGDLQPFQAPAKGDQRCGERPRAGFGAATCGGRAAGSGALRDSQRAQLGQALELPGEEPFQGIVGNIPEREMSPRCFSHLEATRAAGSKGKGASFHGFFPALPLPLGWVRSPKAEGP